MNRRHVLILPGAAALPAAARPGATLAQGATSPAPGPAPRGAPAPPLALPAGMSPLPQGVYRVAFRAGEAALPAGVAPALAEIGRRLSASASGSGRITVEGQASGPANDPSTARRISLARAVEVRRGLVAGGLDETRVDVRPLGRTTAALDCADILPAGRASNAAAAARDPGAPAPRARGR